MSDHYILDFQLSVKKTHKKPEEVKNQNNNNKTQKNPQTAVTTRTSQFRAIGSTRLTEVNFKLFAH